MSEQEIDQMIGRLIAREGGYVNHVADPGKATKYGISARSYPDLDIVNLTVIEAKRIYKRDFFDKFGLQQLENVRSIEYVFDWVVNSGTAGIRTLQRHLGLEVDGKLGPVTAKAINLMPDPRMILLWRLEFFARITKHPFIVGWINRLIELGL